MIENVVEGGLLGGLDSVGEVSSYMKESKREGGRK